MTCSGVSFPASVSGNKAFSIEVYAARDDQCRKRSVRLYEFSLLNLKPRTDSGERGATLHVWHVLFRFLPVYFGSPVR